MDRPDLVAAQETTGGSENDAAGPPLDSICRGRGLTLPRVGNNGDANRIALGELGV